MGACATRAAPTASSPPLGQGVAHGPTHMSHETLADPVSGVELLISRPTSGSGMRDVIYVIDEGEAVFDEFVKAARASHAEVEGNDGRQWHPHVILVGVKSLPKHMQDNPSQYLDYIIYKLTDFIDGRCGSKPYAAGRAICGRSGNAAAIVRSALVAKEHQLHKLFRFYLMGMDAGGSAPDETPLPDKTQAYLIAGSATESARAMQSALLHRCSEGKDISMFVTRDGEQTYTQLERNGPPPVTLDVVDASSTMVGSQDALAAAFVSRSMKWVGERFEATKLQSLGSLLPWHEFK